jgi:hypothetical protein
MVPIRIGDVLDSRAGAAKKFSYVVLFADSRVS